MHAPRIFLAAGEPSGDQHGAAVARALRRRWPAATLSGLGGEQMRAAGVRLLAHVDELAVMGFAEVIRHLPYFMRLLRTVREHLEASSPHVVIPIDYPGFNLRLARLAKQRGIPVVYYIAPQVWAWHRSRMRQLAERTDRLAVILPFEEAWFAAAQANVVYVGHPLVDAQPRAPERTRWCARLGFDADWPVLALLPGSRRQEVRSHLRLFAAAAREVCLAVPGMQVAVARSPAVPLAAYAGTDLPLTDDVWGLLQHARGALVKSGTSTLQAALSGTPLVVAYRVHPLTYALAQRLVRVEHIGLVNLVAGERVAPELVQKEATPRGLAAALVPLLQDTGARRTAEAGLARVRERLTAGTGGRSPAERVVDLVMELLPSSAALSTP